MSGQANKLQSQIESLENYIKALNSDSSLSSEAAAKAIISEFTKAPEPFANGKHPASGETNMWQKAAGGEGGCACIMS